MLDEKEKEKEHESSWQDQLDQVIDRINNREEFSFNLDGEALYQQYKDKYIQQGKMAMEDTIGQASALTGGYGNSYAQMAGQQAYQKSMDDLNAVVPEIYQVAVDRYKNETNDLYNKYSFIKDLNEDKQIIEAQGNDVVGSAATEEGGFYTYAGINSDGYATFYDESGKSRTYEAGINPYTGSKHKDAKYGVFSNGYQPNNIDGTKLKNSGMSTNITGKNQTIWEANGKYWVWYGKQNKYVEVDISDLES